MAHAIASVMARAIASAMAKRWPTSVAPTQPSTYGYVGLLGHLLLMVTSLCLDQIQN